MSPGCACNTSTTSSNNDDRSASSAPVATPLENESIFVNTYNHLQPSTWTLVPYCLELDRTLRTRTSKVELKFVSGIEEINGISYRYEMFMTVVIDWSIRYTPKLKQVHWVTRKKYQDNILIFFEECSSLKRAVYSYTTPFPMVEWVGIRLSPDANTGFYMKIFCALVKRIKHIEYNLM